MRVFCPNCFHVGSQHQEFYLTLGAATDPMEEEQANPMERDHTLSVVLPGGLEKNATVHGSKPVMDLLVTLCASYHLNPSDYTVEFLSPNKNNISFKPNSPIGLLEAEKVVLKPRGAEEKIRRPYMPEATVRLLVNYSKSHKTVVRVNPRVPIETLMPAVCDKCEFNLETTVLLRDSRSREPLDMTKTLDDHGLREVFAKDTTVAALTEIVPPPPLQDLPKKEKKQKENSGLLSLFRRRKQKPEMDVPASAPASSGLGDQVAGGENPLVVQSSNALPADGPKKRRAPLPPMGESQSVPNNLGGCDLRGPQISAEWTLKRTKRRAPPPPSANTHQEPSALAEVKDSLPSLEELREKGLQSPSQSSSSSSSPQPTEPQSPSPSSGPIVARLREVTDPRLPDDEDKAFSDARLALANILTTSLSKGSSVKRLKSSATFPKFNTDSAAQECQDDGVLHAQCDSVLESNPSAEEEWEDPVQWNGLTTFTVVPLKRWNSHKEEVTLDFAGQRQISAKNNPTNEADAEAGNAETDPQEDTRSPDGSQTDFPSPGSPGIPASDGPTSPSPLPDPESLDCQRSHLSGVEVGLQRSEEEVKPEVESELPPLDCSNEKPAGDEEFYSEEMDQTVSYANEKTVEEEEEEEDSFPPPPPPICFNEDMGLEEDGEDPTASSSPSQSPTSTGQTDLPWPSPQSSASPKPPEKQNALASRFAQAVALAVKRSRLQSREKRPGPQVSLGLQSALPSPPRSTYQYGA